jgi:hypothetical protein
MCKQSLIEIFKLLLLNALDGFSGGHVVNVRDLGNPLLRVGIVGSFFFFVGASQGVISAFLLVPVVSCTVKKIICHPLTIIVVEDFFGANRSTRQPFESFSFVLTIVSSSSSLFLFSCATRIIMAAAVLAVNDPWHTHHAQGLDGNYRLPVI